MPTQQRAFRDGSRGHHDAVELEKCELEHDMIVDSLSATQLMASPILADVTAFTKAN